MKIIRTVKEMQQLAHELKCAGETIGYVPTMGYLHEGHLSLMKQAKTENSKVVISIFVNPLQFGPNEDFATYPRDIDRDAQLAKKAGVDYIFYPTVEEMYPNELTVEIKVRKRKDCLCGRKRPGHFDGVATVLIKMFSIVQPSNVYFGLKDAQQVAVVDGLINDFNFPLNLRVGETIREEDGLAKSSRNVNLTKDERSEAKYLYQSLLYGKQFIESGERDPNVIITEVQSFLENKINGTIDYVELYRYPELEPIDFIEGKVILALAVHFSKARLIDNIILDI